MKRFYFTNYDEAAVANDHLGSIRGARRVAQKLANELHETIYINDCSTEDILDVIEPIEIAE